MGVSDLHTRASHWAARRILHLQAISPINKVLGGAVIRVLSMQICRILCRAAGKDSVQEMKIGDVATPVGKREGHIAGIGMIAPSQSAMDTMKSTRGSRPINMQGRTVTNKDIVRRSEQVGRNFQSEGPCFGRS